MLTIHLRITDAATGKPTPVRLRVTGPDGAVYFPFGSHHEFPVGRNEDVGGRVRVGNQVWCYIDGGCEVRLPAGVPLRVRATKGPEYTPLDQTVTLGPGQMALRFTITRWSDVRKDGWHPVDTRTHFIPPHAALLEAAAEDVAVVNLLATETMVPGQDGKLYPSAPHLTAFSGQQPAVANDAATVAVNTLNTHPVLGSVGLLHSHRVVYPLAFGGAEYPDDWSVCDWCDQCHRKGGLTVWTNPFDPGTGLVGGEALVALILGKIDAIEYDGRPRKQPLLPWYYRLLNAGFLVPLVGGSGKDSNHTMLGYPRTYVRPLTTPPPTLPPHTGWEHDIRAARCFVTNGPLLKLCVADGVNDGVWLFLETHHADSPLPVTASAEGLSRFDKLEVVARGQVIGSASPIEEGGRWTARVQFDFTPIRTGWLAARVIGRDGSLLAPDQPVFAHTSPINIVIGRSWFRDPAAIAPLRAAVEQTREWVESHGRFTDAKWKRHLLGLCDAALAKLAPDEASP